MSFIFNTNDWNPAELKRAYQKYGVVVIKGVLNKSEVSVCRDELDKISTKFDKMLFNFNYVKTDCFKLAFKENVIAPIKAAIATPLFIQSDFHVQKNAIGIKDLKTNSGWHCDCGSELQYKPHDYLLEDTYSFAKVAIFLQDYDNGWGGGIKAIPISHKKFYGKGLKGKILQLYGKILSLQIPIIQKLNLNLNPIGSINIPTQAGDLCFFDSRLLHSSTLPDKKNYHLRDKNIWKIPVNETKYVLYSNVGSNISSYYFARNSVRRSLYEEPLFLENGQKKIYSLRTLSESPAMTIEIAFDSELEIDKNFQNTLAENEIFFYKNDSDTINFHKKKLNELMTLSQKN